MKDGMLRSKKEDDGDKPDGENKVPKGFEKFLRKTREKAGGSSKDVEASKKDDKKETRKEQKKEQDDEDLTDEEVEEKDDKKSKKADSNTESTKKKINEFFFQPGGKGPRWDNIALVGFLAGAFGYYLATMGTKSKEVTYVDFINGYLA